MNHRMFVAALVLSAPVAGFVASGCGDDEVFNATDAGSFEAGPVTETGPIPQPDGGDSAVPSTCGNSTGAPQRLLLTMNNFSPPASELVAFNLVDKKVDGRFSFPGTLGATSSLGSDPYVVEQANDVVARMNAQKPWEPVSTWSVVGDDAKDGGSPNAQPVAIVVPTCTKGYVLRFERNKIAVIDTTRAADGGPVDSYVDLTALLQPGDNDGTVDMTSAVYVPSKKRIYVLLGNYDRTTPTPANGYALICKNTKASIIAIDEPTGQLVSLGGTAPGGGIALAGYNPPVSTPLVYDATLDRLVVVQGGCNADPTGAGPISRRVVEQVDLATGQVTTLLDMNDKGFPGGFVFASGTRAALTFYGYPSNQTFFWDPSKTTLGPERPGSFDYIAQDGKGNIVGARRTPVDGGVNIDIVEVALTASDGGTVDAAAAQILGQNPFTTNAGYLGGAEVWPRP